MKIDSRKISDLLAYAKDKYGSGFRIEVTAGWGCAVAEIFLTRTLIENENIRIVHEHQAERILI